MSRDEDRFWSKVRVGGPDECWEWMASLTRHGVCQVRWAGTTMKAQVVALEIAGRKAADGELVRQTCGNALCVNPAHLKASCPATADERFAAYVVPAASGCVEWAGYRNRYGYGGFRLDRDRVVPAHRYAYERSYGPIPRGLVVMHKCDNPACVSPDHLELGTIADNTRDRDDKRRQARGVGHGKAKLSEDQVVAMRRRFERGEKVAAVAEAFGVHPATASHIKTRRIWKHLLP